MEKIVFLASDSLTVYTVNSTGSEKGRASCFAVKTVTGSVLREALVMGGVGMVAACSSSIPCSHRAVNLCV